MTADWKMRANKPRNQTTANEMFAPADPNDGELGDEDVYDGSPPNAGISVPVASQKEGYSMVAVRNILCIRHLTYNLQVVRTSTPISVKQRTQKPKHPSSASHPRVKKEVKDDRLDLDDQDDQPSTADIPLFARSQWVAKGLPTFQHYLLASHTPFGKEFGKNGRFVKVAQECINAAYPGNKYIVRENDVIFAKVKTLSLPCKSTHVCLCRALHALQSDVRRLPAVGSSTWKLCSRL